MTLFKVRLLIGTTIFMLGVLIYLTRSTPIYIIQILGIEHCLYPLNGKTTENFPTFAHSFFFILITAGILDLKGKKSYFIIALGWFIFNSSLEMLQGYRGNLSKIPNFFYYIPFLENTKSYIQKGTFDILDILSIAIGSLLSFLVLVIIDKFFDEETNSKRISLPPK